MTESSSFFELPETWQVVIPTDDDSITRRRRALAPIQMLTDLERTKSSLDGDFWDDYDLFRIALSVIDQVALAMGLSAGRTWDEILDYASDQAARQCPDANAREWAKVGERVVVSLVTTNVEIVRHLVHTVDGPVWRQQRFRLLYLHPTGADGLEHLRASEQAINIFVEALDLDIEAAQIANEAQLAALIARGAVESAVQIARHARYRSIQFQERIRRVVADTLIDPDTHDWLGDVPALLDNALHHVKDRLEAEAALLDTVAERRAATSERSQLEATNLLIEILKECRHRHSDLHRHLMGARSALRQALDDRFTRPPGQLHRIDLGADLLLPLLSGSTVIAAKAADRLLAVMGGIPVRWWPSLTTLIDELCTPPRMPELGVEYEPPEVDFADELEWWEPYEAAADALLGGLTEPLRLSQLLARIDEVVGEIETDEVGDGVADIDLLTATVVHAAHHAWAPHLAGRSAGDRLVLAVPSGKELITNTIRANDLILVPAELTIDIQASGREFRQGHPIVTDEEQEPSQ
ncbi:hypothetical protein [Nocardia abscessus]|uniref:hypothetical protein n=1 Tax=Nocardia abscessus TaxID=120957 RepID=UPI0024587B6A|nr:hypothetical protein [Nocardia abscessus]